MVKPQIGLNDSLFPITTKQLMVLQEFHFVPVCLTPFIDTIKISSSIYLIPCAGILSIHILWIKKLFIQFIMHFQNMISSNETCIKTKKNLTTFLASYSSSLYQLQVLILHQFNGLPLNLQKKHSHLLFTCARLILNTTSC